MNTIASNMANAQTTKTEEGGPYVKKNVVFQTMMVGEKAGEGLDGVQVSGVVEDTKPPIVVYDPGHPDADESATLKAVQSLQGFCDDGVEQLAKIILQGAEQHQSGVLLLNSLSFSRRVVVDLPGFAHEPIAHPAVKSTQFDETRKQAVVELPAAGFVWLQPGQISATPPKSSVPLQNHCCYGMNFLKCISMKKPVGLHRSKSMAASRID